MRAVYVDDDADAREIMKFNAEKCGVSMEIFETGGEALKFLAKETVDLVILDLALPDFDGLSIAQAIRRYEKFHPKRDPVDLVFFTGSNINEGITRIGEQVGVRKIYPKPYDFEELLNEVSPSTVDR